LWRGPSDPPLSPGGVPSIAGLLDALVGAERGAEIADGLHAVAAVMPSEPHVYLNFLAVAPSRQERGLGRLAIAPVLSAARSAGLFVYLGTTNPANHGFFERLGFVESRSVAIGDGPRLRAMRWDG
jgi:GNAT superfamily N-acetyltransferase